MTGVLIPTEIKGLTPLPEGVEPIYYTCRSPSFSERLKNKLLKSQSNVFKYKIIVVNKARLNDVKAVWLSAGTVLNTAETKQLLAQLSSLQWVYSQRAGTDHLALSTYRQNGIKVSTTGNMVSTWVAQMNLACILSHSKMLPTHIIKQRAFRSRPIFCEDITDQHVGILGTGNIGNKTADMCSALGMKVTGISKRPQEIDTNITGYDAVCDIVDIDTVLADIDYLVLTLPLSAQTKKIIDRHKLAKLKQTACLINLARPQVVDEKALLSSLKNNDIAAAYVSGVQDVSRIESIVANRLPNLVITHYSDANLKKKKTIAFQQFSKGLIDLSGGREVENRII